MKTIIATNDNRQDIIALLKKPAFDDVVLGLGAKQRIKELFGQELSAQAVVAQIVAAVRERGDQAVLDYTKQLDGISLTPETLEISAAELAAAVNSVETAALSALRRAAENVRRYHIEQKPRSSFSYRDNGVILGQTCLPLARVGIYIPGGKASYPSSVIMNAIPAAVAGVEEIIMAVPPRPDGTIDPLVLAAAHESGVSRVFRVGGAQAVAALAFGTETIPQVDKITGPGNIFVTLAKKAVYGYCDIDMLAGPSEILILADASANSKYIAADLLSQAEHDELASAVLITTDLSIAQTVTAELERQLQTLPRRELARTSLANQGVIIVVDDLSTAVSLANIAAPEHLEIMTVDPFNILPYIKNAGAIFLGQWSPEALGDYYAGPNHVLPTGGTARFYSLLNVETFMKRNSVIAYTKPALTSAAEDIITLAKAEGLEAHARAVAIRMDEHAL